MIYTCTTLLYQFPQINYYMDIIYAMYRFIFLWPIVEPILCMDPISNLHFSHFFLSCYSPSNTAMADTLMNALKHKSSLYPMETPTPTRV